MSSASYVATCPEQSVLGFAVKTLRLQKQVLAAQLKEEALLEEKRKTVL